MKREIAWWVQFITPFVLEFYASREREMMAKAKEAMSLKMIQLRGPQSKEDMYKLWLINTGRVVLPEDWDRIGAAPQQPDTKEQQNLFREGLIRIPKFLPSANRGQNAADLQARHLWGNVIQSSAARNPFGPEPPNAGTARPLQGGKVNVAHSLISNLKQQ